MTRTLSTMGFAAALAFAGCDGGGGGMDAGRDSGAVADTGPARDSGPERDAGPFPADADPPMPDAGDPCADLTLPALAIEPIASGASFENPVYVTQAPGSSALFVVEQPGRIRRVEGDSVTDFLDIRSRVDFGGERGLLGLAFHPEYETNGRFFIYYTPNAMQQNVVAEYARSGADPTLADDTELARLMEINDPETNHNGGMLTFGPDGYLYVGTGDGGGAGDRHGPTGNGLNLETLLGKILRLDVDNAAGDYVAAGNPFVGEAGLDQIWAYGIRNPWRFSFDRLTDDLWIADVGQNMWEEIDFQPASSAGGENYGWRAYEGHEVFEAANLDLAANHTEPIHVFAHGSDSVLPGACSVTGGYVYRGDAIPALRGWYLFGDFCSNSRAAFKYCDGAVQGLQEVPGIGGFPITNVTSFGEDLAGELYMTGNGVVVRIVPG